MPTGSPEKIPTRQLGMNGPHVSAIGLGALRAYPVLLEIESLTYSLMGLITGFGMLRRDNSADQKAANEALTHAADRGMTFWDTADVYGDGESSSTTLNTFQITYPFTSNSYYR